jgi:hypothetical protein
MSFGPLEIPLAGIVIELVSGVAGTMILLTGLLAAAFRAFAILAESQPERVEWLTAVGFLSGLVFSALFLALDVVLD